MRIQIFRFWLFEILIGPAQVWIWICATLCGVETSCDWDDETDDSPTQE